MGASITLAGESLIAQKLGAQQPLIVSRFVLANVPSLDPNAPVDRTAGKPVAGQIVGTFDVTQKGYVNPNQVVYSLMMGSDVGDFDWNWIGLETAENVLLAVAYVPVQQKRRNIPPLQLGNNVTRNFLVVFDGAQELTGITIDASTWQHDFTVRLKGIDERERLSNRDVYGRACFFGSSLQLVKVGTEYQLNTGTAYVEGIRLECTEVVTVTPPKVPISVWLDVSLQRQMNDVQAIWTVVFSSGMSDYTDSAGVRHYCIHLADLFDSSSVHDRRPVEPIDGPLVTWFAARTGDYQGLRARSTTKEDVGLGNVPNALSDDQETNSSFILATTKAIKTATTLLWTALANIVSGATVVGQAEKLAVARRLSLSGAASGQTSFDGSADVNISMTLANSGIAPGTYTKPTFNAKGLAISGENPTTLAGYSITDAWSKAEMETRYVGVPGPNVIQVSWEAGNLSAKVDGAGVGKFWTTSNFDPSIKLNKGDYGLGGTTPSGLGIDTVGLPGGFYIKGDGETSFANYTSLINIPYADGFAAQLGFGQANDEPQVLVRACKSYGVWGKTRKLWHTGNLEVAQQFEVDAGQNDSSFVTPKKMRSGFYFLPAVNGVIALPTWLGGIIVQWGKVTLNDGNSAIINFPLAFPTGVLASWSSINVNIASFATTCPCSATSDATLAGMTVSYNDNNGALGVVVGWFAIGR